LASLLQHARFVVVPSIWHENFPYVINQSFAFGRPVIGARRGGITELVDHGTRGLIFDPDNVEELAQAMITLASNEDLACRMGKAAKSWSDDLFRDEIAYGDIIKAYEVAIRAHNSHRR
jgi:glycosyltransferase involved in cell wall biosynthesis